MRNTTTMVAVLLVAAVTSGIAMMPVQAVTASCSSSLTIEEGRPLLSSTLGADSSVTWNIVIGNADSKKVVVELSSSEDELHFGVFVPDGMDCDPAKDHTGIECSAHEELQTVNQSAPRTRECPLEAPSSGTLTYYFHLVNPQQDSLQYRIWFEDTA